MKVYNPKLLRQQPTFGSTSCIFFIFWSSHVILRLFLVPSSDSWCCSDPVASIEMFREWPLEEKKTRPSHLISKSPLRLEVRGFPSPCSSTVGSQEYSSLWTPCRLKANTFISDIIVLISLLRDMNFRSCTSSSCHPLRCKGKCCFPPKSLATYKQGWKQFCPLERGIHFHMKREGHSNPFIHVRLVGCAQYWSNRRQSPLQWGYNTLHIYREDVYCGFRFFFFATTDIRQDKIRHSETYILFPFSRINPVSP